MKEFLSLKVLDRLRGPLERLGADYPVLRMLVQTKLTMDARRVPTIFNQSSRNRKIEGTESGSFVKALWIYALIGIITVPFILMNSSYMLSMSFVFGILMFMIMTSMISDFSSVLLDIRDRVIIGTKPVSRRTAALAKLVHISIYLIVMTGSIAAAPLVTALVRHGVWFFLIFLLELVLLDVLVVVLTAFVYLTILTFFDGEKLKDVINGVQIALSIAIMIIYQMVGRSFQMLQLHIVFQPRWWQAFVPPVWLAAPFEWLLRGNRESSVAVLSLLALLVPIIAFLIYIRLMPAFERGLNKLANNSLRKGDRKGAVLRVVSGFICRDPEERAFFQFAYRMMGNERDFKLKVYPSLGMSIVFPFILMSNYIMQVGWAGIASSHWYLDIYFCAIMIPTVLLMLKNSSHFNGAWVYMVAPISSPRPILTGAVKAFVIRLLLPLYVVEGFLFGLIFGARVIPDLIAAGLGMLFYTVICFRFLRKALPFSEPFGAVSPQGRFAVLPLLAVIIVLLGVHWASSLVTGGLYGYMLLLVFANLIAWRFGFRLSWQQLKPY